MAEAHSIERQDYDRHELPPGNARCAHRSIRIIEY